MATEMEQLQVKGSNGTFTFEIADSEARTAASTANATAAAAKNAAEAAQKAAQEAKSTATNVEAELEGKQPKGNYATENFVTTKIAEAKMEGADVDLSGYATKDDIPKKTSQLTNDSGFLTEYTETDPTVPAWAKQAQKPAYTAEEVGAMPAGTKIPAKLSELENDKGYITGYTETDPTVPAWAKAAKKPTYTAAEVGALPDTTVIPTVPSTLPNPKKLKFVGGATGEYDGSSELIITIPEAVESSGGSQELPITDMDGYKIAPTGTILAGTAGTQLVSEPIAVSGGDQLLVTGSAKFGNSLWAVYDTAGTLLLNEVAPATEAGASVEDREVEVPAGAASFRVAWDKAVSATSYAVARVSGQGSTGAALPLSGVKCAIIGDSIVEKNATASVNFVDLVAAGTGAEITNLGVGGTGWMNGQDEGNAFYQRVDQIPEDTQRVLFYGSGNDRELTLGDPDDTGTDTVCGCINTALDAVYARIPAAWVGIIAPAPWQYYPPHESGNAMEELAQAQAAICRRRGIPFLDLYHTSGLRPWDDAFRALAFADGDGVHPNDIGHSLIAPQVQAFLLGSATPMITAQTAGGGDCNIQRIESLEDGNLKNLRDLDSGTYILYGYFNPYSGSEDSITIDNCVTAVVHLNAGSHVMVYNPRNFKIECYEILGNADEGYTYTRNVVSLLELDQGSDSGETTEQPEYVRVKYLENTGTQYIDTGYVIQEDDVIEVDYEIPESALSVSTDKILIDARDASNGIRVSTWGSNYKWYARFGHSSGTTTAAYSNQHQKGTFSISKNTLVLNGATVLSDMPFTAMPTGTLKLFSGVSHDTGAISGPSYARIIQVKVKRNGETIHCYVSKQRTSDSELGMHDTVTGEFFTNAGTGIFGYAPADVVESTTVQRKPTLTDEQKAAMQALMDDYYNNRGTFYYEFTHNRNAFTSGGSCYTSAKGKFKMCCATFVQNIMMGRSVNDFVGKNASTYSATITKTPVSDFGYYFDFKYRKYLYGLTDTDENGNTVYYGYNQPNADNYEGSYSYNSYYHPDSTKANKQNFNGFCNANDMARELYEMGCEIPFSELDVGDIIFTLDNDLSDNSSMLNFHAWRNIYHVGMVYDVKQIDASSKEIYYIECTSYFDVDNRPIEKPFLSSSQMDLRFKAFKLTEDMAFCARMPVAFGYEANVPDRITTSAVP